MMHEHGSSVCKIHLLDGFDGRDVIAVDIDSGDGDAFMLHLIQSIVCEF